MDFRLTQIIIFFITAFLMKIAIADPIRDEGQIHKTPRKIYVSSQQLH